MELINRKNAVVILCCVYTIISIWNTLLEVLFDIRIQESALNNLTILGVSSIAIFVLALQKRFQEWNLILVIILQYVIFIGSIMSLTWLLGKVEPLHPDGYRDMFFSCSSLYGIGAVVYYISFFHEIRRQNKMLEKVHDES